MRAFAYVRISKDRYKTSLSPERQRAEIKRVAKAKGFAVVEWFEERDRSAYRRVRRPLFEQMLSRVAEVDAVFVWELSRLARRTVIGVGLLDTLEANNVRLVSTSQGDSTEVSRLYLEMMFAFAAEESRIKSERVQLAHRHMALTLGRPVTRQRSFGFDYDQERKAVSVRADEARIVRLMAQRYLAGAGDTAIARELNDGTLAGAPVPAVRSEQWGASSVAYLLKSPTIAGLVTYKGRIVADDQPAIIDRQTWDALQATRATRRRASRRPSRGPGFLLYGMARCASCQGPLRSTGPGEWDSYRCTRYYERGMTCEDRACIGRVWLDSYVTDEFFRIVNERRLKESTRRHLEQTQGSPAQTLRVEQARLEAALDRLRDAYAVHSEISMDTYSRGVAELEGQIEVVREKVAALEETRILQSEAAWLDRPIEVLWRDHMTLPEQRELMSAFIDRVEVTHRPKGARPDSRYVAVIPRLT